MNLRELRKKYSLIDLFVELAEIPSPSLKENTLSQRILEIFNIHNISAKFDSYGNIIAKIPSSVNCKNVEPVLLSAHMDVVGGSEPVNIVLAPESKYIETDKKRTLGADNKAGIAAIMDLAISLNDLNSKVEHGPVEITFTRDEEMGMSGIENLDTSKLKSKYAIIADAARLGEHDIEGAGFTNVYVKIHKGRGGHSGINIDDEKRINAIKVLSELDSKIPQGVFKKDEKGVITSINAGATLGGSVDTCISEMLKQIYKLAKENKQIPEKYEVSRILDTICLESAVNIINTQAVQSYSIRSSDPQSEKELLDLIRKEVDILNKKYSGLIKVDMEIECHLKAFITPAENPLSQAIIEAGKKNDLNTSPGTFHAGAETHILANEKKNANNENFITVLMGIANLENLHSPDEKLDWISFIKGRKLLEDAIVTFAENYKK